MSTNTSMSTSAQAQEAITSWIYAHFDEQVAFL